MSAPRVRPGSALCSQEVVPSRFKRRKGVGFMHEAGVGNNGHRISPLGSKIRLTIHYSTVCTQWLSRSLYRKPPDLGGEACSWKHVLRRASPVMSHATMLKRFSKHRNIKYLETCHCPHIVWTTVPLSTVPRLPGPTTRGWPCGSPPTLSTMSTCRSSMAGAIRDRARRIPTCGSIATAITAIAPASGACWRYWMRTALNAVCPSQVWGIVHGYFHC